MGAAYTVRQSLDARDLLPWIVQNAAAEAWAREKNEEQP